MFPLPLWKVQFFPDDVATVVLTLCCALCKFFFCFYRCYVDCFTQFQSVSGGSLSQVLVSAALVLFFSVSLLWLFGWFSVITVTKIMDKFIHPFFHYYLFPCPMRKRNFSNSISDISLLKKLTGY